MPSASIALHRGRLRPTFFSADLAAPRDVPVATPHCRVRLPFVMSCGGAVAAAHPGIVISAADAGDTAAIAQVSMDAFYGRPWPMGSAAPWIKTKGSGLAGLAEQLWTITGAYQSPTGKEYPGWEYALNRQRLEARLKTTAKEQSQPQGAQTMAVAKAVDTASGRIVGAVELILLSYPASPSPKKPYLFNLCVDQGYRGRGIGRSLVTWCEELSRDWGYGEMFLHVEDDAVRQIYSKYGYSATYQKPSFIELNLQNIVVKPIADETASSVLRAATDNWVIMHRRFPELAPDVGAG